MGATISLTKLEERILLAVYRLDGHAYGVSVMRHLEEQANESLAVGTVYVQLDRLARRELVTARDIAPTATRGGRRKRAFAITKTGMLALERARQSYQQLWMGFPQQVGVGGGDA